jgi:hypothetical protein
MDLHRSQSACEALGHIGSKEALPILVKLLSHEDRWVRVLAGKALANMGAAVKPAIPDMLVALVNTSEPLTPIQWADPVQLSQGELAKTLFRNQHKDALRQAGTNLLYAAIQAVSRNADGMTRALLRRYFEQDLTLEDMRVLGPDVLLAARIRAPADTMFGNEIRMGALKVLTKYHYLEGIEAGVSLAKTQGGHGSENRTGEIMKEIVSYGSAARSAIPGLRELIAQFEKEVKTGRFPGGSLNKRRVDAVTEAIKTIESATTQPELLRIGEHPALNLKVRQ